MLGGLIQHASSKTLASVYYLNRYMIEVVIRVLEYNVPYKSFEHQKNFTVDCYPAKFGVLLLMP